MTTSTTGIPLSYQCHHCHEVMERPYLAPCSHLFDQECIEKGIVKCPSDGMKIDQKEGVFLSDLGQAITLWNKGKSKAALMGEMIEKVEDVRKISLISTMYNAHQDDIHALIKYQGGFVSGSKDTSIKIWNHDLSLRKEMHRRGGYQRWVTTLAPLRNGNFVSGSRDGVVAVWSQNGERISYFDHKHEGDVHAKVRNENRIHCLVESLSTQNEEELIFAGAAKEVQLWNLQTSQKISSWEADGNDWVYCIEPLKEDQIITVIGTRMEIWSSIFDKHSRHIVIKEEKKHKAQRSYISSFTRIENNANNSLQVASAFFDGSVRLTDLSTAQTICRFQHISEYVPNKMRVWQVAQLKGDLLVSGADDGKIKFWDLRQRACIIEIGDNPGRVSCLLKIDEARLITGSCPDRFENTDERGSFRIWDIRRL